MPNSIQEPVILPRDIPKSDTMPKIWAAVILVMVGLSAALLILLLRPNSDPVSIVSVILPAIAVFYGQFINYSKADSTHKLVNSQLSEFKRVIVENARREGRTEGAFSERIRPAEAAPHPPDASVQNVVAAPATVIAGETSVSVVANPVNRDA